MSANRNPIMIPVLFDTDIGSDIDDAVALAYLLKQTDCELVGITCVSGDTQKRAALADYVCRAAGKTNIPIYAGLSGPLLWGPGQPDVPQYEAIQNKPHRKPGDFDPEAVLFLCDTIRARPGEITLLAVGPLTNIAALFALDPEIPSLLKRLVLMCGVFTGANGHGPETREWNALVDPVAAALVFGHGEKANRLLSVGLDVTTKVKLPHETCRTRFKNAGGALGVVGDLAEVWFKNVPEITFHDPLAAALLFAPDLCGYETGTVSVHAQDDKLAGLTRWKAGEDGPHQIGVSVDADGFFENYFGVTGG